MGQKVHPYGLRVGIIKDWRSRWYAKKSDFHNMLIEDQKIKRYVKKKLSSGAVSAIEIERTSQRVRIIIHTARPGIVIGRKGAEIETLRGVLQPMVGEKQVLIDIKEIKNATMEAQLVAENIALQLERRIHFRRAIKKSMQLARDAGCEGIRIKLGGRLGGAEIARKETLRYGKVPLQTLRADIDYGFTEAHTTYGLIGIQVWIYKGEKFQIKDDKEQKKWR
ncbi:MAG: 30S ribosomal protein S3 [Candidatus Omnitrophota bacterium]